MQNFHYVGVLLDMLYGIELGEDTLEEIGLLAWRLIGNRNVKLYRYCTSICSDLSVTLPCNALLDENTIEAVTTSYEDWSRTTNYSDNGDVNTSFVENTIEAQKAYNSPFYISGKLLKYEKVGDKLYFDKNYGKIQILYKGILTDEDGLPELTDKEALAISTYIAYIIKFKESLVTNNQQISAQAVMLKAQWLQQCDQARVTYLNQNDMNNIIEIRNSWNRVNYSKTYKPLP